jgi:hypothetical protein
LLVFVAIAGLCFFAIGRLRNSGGKSWQRHVILSPIRDLPVIGVGAYGDEGQPPYFGYILIHPKMPQRLPPQELSNDNGGIRLNGRIVGKPGSQFRLAIIENSEISFVAPEIARSIQNAFSTLGSLTKADVEALLMRKVEHGTNLSNAP